MQTIDANPEGETKTDGTRTIWATVKKCWGRFLIWKGWFCDPEGPTLTNVIQRGVLRWLVGIPLILTGVAFGFATLPFAAQATNSVFGFCANVCGSSCIDFFRYLAATLVFLGSTAYFLGAHARRLELKTGVYNEEIDNLIREVELLRDFLHNAHALKDNIDREIGRLKLFKEMPSEVSFLRLIALRKLHVEAIGEFEALKALAESELADYVDYVGSENPKFLSYRNMFNSLYRDHDKALDTENMDEPVKKVILELKTHVKELREEVQWEKYLAGQGEAILKSITHWSIPAIISLFLLGVTPLLHEPIFEESLTFLHWGLLGMAGAIIYTASHMRTLEASSVGFEEGNTELRKMLLGIVVGAIGAILLYAAIRSGIFGGKALPKFEPLEGEQPTPPYINNALTIFWAIAAGYSAKLLDRLLGASDKGTAT